MMSPVTMPDRGDISAKWDSDRTLVFGNNNSFARATSSPRDCRIPAELTTQPGAALRVVCAMAPPKPWLESDLSAPPLGDDGYLPVGLACGVC